MSSFLLLGYLCAALFVNDFLWLFADSQKWDHQFGVMAEEAAENENSLFLKLYKY